MTAPLTPEEIVALYVKRMERKDVPQIPLGETGVYQIIGASQSSGDFDTTPRREGELVQGRFIDVIAYTFRNGMNCIWKGRDPDNPNSGYIRRASVPEIHPVPENASLDALLK